MKAPIPLYRRIGIAVAALAIAAALFRHSAALAVVARADDALRAGDEQRAVVLYARAVRLDGTDATAADRLAFALLARHSRDDDRAALAVAASALGAHAGDAALLVDRALAENRLHLLAPAERDFAAAGRAACDARYAHFAGTVALARGRREAARGYFRAALSYDAAFRPARAALRRLRRS